MYVKCFVHFITFNVNIQNYIQLEVMTDLLSRTKNILQMTCMSHIADLGLNSFNLS